MMSNCLLQEAVTVITDAQLVLDAEKLLKGLGDVYRVRIHPGGSFDVPSEAEWDSLPWQQKGLRVISGSKALLVRCVWTQ